MNFPKANEPVTWEFVLQYPFPYKVWFIVNINYMKFINWSKDGTSIEIDLFGLQDYLLSTISIFKIKNLAIFLQHLEDFQFKRVEIISLVEEASDQMLVQYSHANFQRSRYDLLKKICRKQPYVHVPPLALHKQQPMEASPMAELSNIMQNLEMPTAIEHMKKDVCFVKYGTLTPLQFRRLTQQVFMKFENETRILREKFREADSRYAKAGVMARPEDNSIPVNEDMYENPQESAIVNEPTENECAGFFGTASKRQLQRFFGNCMPKYEREPNGSTKIVVNLPSKLSQKENQDYDDVDNDFDNDNENENFNDDDIDNDNDNDNENEPDNVRGNNGIKNDNKSDTNKKNNNDKKNKNNDAVDNINRPFNSNGNKLFNFSVKSNNSNDNNSNELVFHIEVDYNAINKPTLADPNEGSVGTNDSQDSEKGFFFQDILKLKPVDTTEERKTDNRDSCPMDLQE